MKKHNWIFLVILIVLSPLLSVACSKQQEDNLDSGKESQLELTLEELTAYNGKNGNPAYVAVDGVIYDVTGNPKWEEAKHHGLSAGQDLTDQIKDQSPHGLSALSKLSVVGKLKE